MGRMAAKLNGGSMTPFEEVPMPPTLPKSLLDTIGEYGMARTDRVSELTIQHRWELLIAAIKDYARAYGDQRANAALEQAYDAMFSLKGDKVTRFDAQTAIRKLKTDSPTARGCPWTPDTDGYLKTACGKSHAFNEGGPTENQHRFCCYCGGAITMKENGDEAHQG